MISSTRAARPEDAAQIASVHVASSRAAYEGLLPPEVIDSLTQPRLEQRWRVMLETRHAEEERLVVAEEGPELIAYSRYGPARDEDSMLAGGCAEIYGFYVHPEHWGRGVGRELMDHVLDDLGRRRYVTLTLNVVEGNERARFFYERVGFVLDKAAAPWYGAPQVRYRKDL